MAMKIYTEHQRLTAIERANEVFQLICRITNSKDQIRQIVDHHGVSNAHNIEKRDCKAFNARLIELGIWDQANSVDAL